MGGSASVPNPFSDSPGLFGLPYRNVSRGIGITKDFQTFGYPDKGFGGVTIYWHFHGYTGLSKSF
jgi:hypothetical protein